MNKAEFLQELEQRLRVLEKQEVEDMVREYAQHIDMKLQNGQTEAEAIADFGSIDELAAEILSAYHVNPAYDEKAAADAPPQAEEASKHLGAAAGIKAVFAAFGKAVRGGFALIGKGFSTVWQGICMICSFVVGLLVKAWQVLMGKTVQSPPIEVQGENGTVYMPGAPVQKPGLLLRLFKFALYLALVFAVLVALVPLTVFALGSVFAFGITLVMQLGGYPLMGPLLISLGVVLMCVSLWLLCVSLLGRGKRQKVQEC